MEWVQGYVIFIITATILLPLIKHGERKKCPLWNGSDGFISVFLFLPIYGRIFGWW